MIAVGIDIGKEKHAAAILDAGGRPLAKPAFFDNTHDGARKLWGLIARHAGGRLLAKPAFFDNTHDGARRLWALIARHAPGGHVRVGMEATGNCWKPFHDFLAAKGAEVDVMNPIVSSASTR